MKNHNYYIFKGLRVFSDIRKALSFYKEFHSKHYYIMKVPPLPESANKELTYYNYKVNPYKITCTCPSFKENVQLYKHKRDIRRVCKHLYYKMDQYTTLPALITLLLENQLAHGPEKLIKRKNNGILTFYGIKNLKTQIWFNIYIQNPEIPERFRKLSYNTEEKRWSYGVTPVDNEIYEKQLRNIIKQLTL